jgi:hypothetical protein
MEMAAGARDVMVLVLRRGHMYVHVCVCVCVCVFPCSLASRIPSSFPAPLLELIQGRFRV